MCKLEPLNGQRQKGESDKAVQACNDWLRIGSGRTLPKLLEKYTNSSQESPPTSSLGTLKQWSLKFNWLDRAAEFDATWEERKNAEREAVLNHGLALEYERVSKLYRLQEFLETQLFERGEDGDYHNVWLPDVKQIGSGEYAERVDLERFNASLLREYRETLNDIAQEVGGRTRKQELTGKDGSELTIKIIRDGDDFADTDQTQNPPSKAETDSE
jgi:hypothetical protein